MPMLRNLLSAFGRSLGLVLALAFALGACAPRQETVTFWAMGREGEVVTELLPEFERAHPGVKVVVQQLPWSAAHEKLLTAFAGDATPDVAQMGNTWIPEMAALMSANMPFLSLPTIRI